MLSVWGILLVCLGHSGFTEPIIMDSLNGLHSWIYSFHMPLFFLISGYLFSLTNKSFVDIDPGKFLKKKVLRLLVPYVVLGTVIYGIKYVFSSFSHADRDWSVANFFKMFVAPGCEGSTMGYLWYVITLFVVFAIVVAFCIVRVDLKKIVWCVLVMLAAWTFFFMGPKVEWFNFMAVCQYLPYFVIGILYQRYEPKVQTIVDSGGQLSLIVLAALTLVPLFVSIPLPNWILMPMKAIIGIMMSVQLCNLLLKSDWVVNNIYPTSKYTYCIYLLSWFPQYAVKVGMMDIMHLHWAIAVASMFVAQLVVPVLVCMLVDKVDWLSKQKWIRLIIGY